MRDLVGVGSRGGGCSLGFWDTLDDLAAVLPDVAGDALGKEALGRVSRVTVGAGKQAAVSWSCGILSITTVLAGPERRWSRDELRKAIDAAP